MCGNPSTDVFARPLPPTVGTSSGGRQRSQATRLDNLDQNRIHVNTKARRTMGREVETAI